MAQPLMPHATASWLVENTSLTFEQIAEFCGLHILEVQAIADDTAAIGDAENDHAFLTVSECAVAVANALPALKQHADMVTTGTHGDGVTELIGRLIDSDLADVELELQHLVDERRARDVDEIHDLLRVLGPLSLNELSVRTVDRALVPKAIGP